MIKKRSTEKLGERTTFDTKIRINGQEGSAIYMSDIRPKISMHTLPNTKAFS